MTVLYLRGGNSAVGCVKPTYLKYHGHEVIEPILDHDDFHVALQAAQRAFEKHQPDVVVGSSRGGAVAVNLDSGDARLVLICPAWKKWGTATTVKHDTTILHSRADDVIPFEDSVELLVNSGLPRRSGPRPPPGGSGTPGGGSAGGGGARLNDGRPFWFLISRTFSALLSLFAAHSPFNALDWVGCESW